MSPEPCHCPAPSAACRRAGAPMLGRLWELCAGHNCPAGLSAAYRALWDRGPARPDGPGRERPCAHLGGPTGGRVLCPSCRGHVEVKVLGCARYGACTLARQVPGLACCATCADYVPAEAAPDPPAG